MEAPIPQNEEARLAVLRDCRILDTPHEEQYDDITSLAAEICSVPIAAVTLVDADRQWFKSILGLDARQMPRDTAFCAHTLLEPELMVVPDAHLDERFAANPLVTGDPGVRFYAGAPLVTYDGYAVGSLCVIDRVPRQLTDSQLRALRILARQVTGQIELVRRISAQERLIAELEEAETKLKDYAVVLEFQMAETDMATKVLASMSTSDGLTGLKNRRTFHERLSQECMRAERSQTPISVLMLDIDDFAKYNSAHGYPEANRVLKTIASVLEAHTRPYDIVARYGGDEFAVAVPETNPMTAHAAAERLRERIADIPWELRPITVSVGVSSIVGGLYTPEDLVEHATHALHISRAVGGDRVTSDTDLSSESPLDTLAADEVTANGMKPHESADPTPVETT